MIKFRVKATGQNTYGLVTYCVEVEEQTQTPQGNKADQVIKIGIKKTIEFLGSLQDCKTFIELRGKGVEFDLTALNEKKETTRKKAAPKAQTKRKPK